ncbi:tetratricopeptide repeat protein [Streptomyces radiopugnans]|nr:tetratricopeptide repeat protein [Streptomyces radiopugnans]
MAKATALKGRLPEAAEHYGRSVRECERLDLSDRARVYSLTGLANTLADLGDAAGAVDHYRRALERHTAADRTRVVMLLRCAEAVADRGDGPEALGLLAEAGRITAGIGDEVGAAHVERVRALVAVLGHDWPRARSALVSALEVLRAHNEASGTAQALRSLGDTEIGAGRTQEACGALREALSLYRGMRAPVEIARTEARLSAALVLAGEPPSVGGHAAAFRSALDRYGLPLYQPAPSPARTAAAARRRLSGGRTGTGRRPGRCPGRPGRPGRRTGPPPGPAVRPGPRTARSAYGSDRGVAEAVPGYARQHVPPGDDLGVRVPADAEPVLRAVEPGLGVRAPDAVHGQTGAHEVVAHGLDEHGVAAGALLARRGQAAEVGVDVVVVGGVVPAVEDVAEPPAAHRVHRQVAAAQGAALGVVAVERRAAPAACPAHHVQVHRGARRRAGRSG